MPRAAKSVAKPAENWSIPIQIFVPRCGTRLKLAADWRFRLFSESRNKLWDMLTERGESYKHPSPHWSRPYQKVKIIGDAEEHEIEGWGDNQHPLYVILPSDIELVVDRVYIRRESGTSAGLNQDGGFDSLTFRADLPKGTMIGVAWRDTDTPKWIAISKKVSARFWAKLGDVNTMKAQIVIATAVVPIDAKANKPTYDHSLVKATQEVISASVNKDEAEGNIL
jgi:hypothetical protein